jgi:serine/threonine-protein phosphatase 2A regulatory subunit B''
MGFINERELERFIMDRIPEMSACRELPDSFYPYYVFTASRRFLFFLNSRKTRHIRVKKLAHSAVMEEMLFLQRISKHKDKIDHKTFTSQVNGNWFSGNNALRVFSVYVGLDKDMNGMLSQEELLAFTGSVNESVQLTRTAVKRIFEENITYLPMEMDYKTFLDLLLALEYRATLESMTYFWRILDLDRSGRLSPATIKYFYKDIFESLKSTGYEAPLAENIAVEIFDILACNDSRGPTFQDLVSSDQGHTVISMLLDVNGFWHYDNR